MTIKAFKNSSRPNPQGVPGTPCGAQGVPSAPWNPPKSVPVHTKFRICVLSLLLVLGNSAPPIRALALQSVPRNHRLTIESTGKGGQGSHDHGVIDRDPLVAIQNLLKPTCALSSPNIFCDILEVLTMFEIEAFYCLMHIAHFGIVTVIIC